MKITPNTDNYVYLGIMSQKSLATLSVILSQELKQTLQLYAENIFANKELSIFFFNTPKSLSSRVHNVDYILRIEKNIYSENFLKKIKKIPQIDFVSPIEAKLIPKKYRWFL